MFNNFTSIECCSCHMAFGVTGEFYTHRRDDHKTFYCPSCGTAQSFTGKSDAEKLRLENQRLVQRLAQKDDSIRWQREQREKAEKRVIAYKGIVTKTKKRIAGGACPCCNRNFQNLAAHMATKHKDYAHKDEVA